jgi:hypothetical protein
MQDTLRPWRHRSGVLVSFEVNQQQNEKHDDGQHEDTKASSSPVRASCWYAFHHALIKHENLAGILSG